MTLFPDRYIPSPKILAFNWLTFCDHLCIPEAKEQRIDFDFKDNDNESIDAAYDLC